MRTHDPRSLRIVVDGEALTTHSTETAILDRLRDWEVGSELADAIEREKRGTREWRMLWESAGFFLLDCAERRTGEACYDIAESGARSQR